MINKKFFQTRFQVIAKCLASAGVDIGEEELELCDKILMLSRKLIKSMLRCLRAWTLTMSVSNGAELQMSLFYMWKAKDSENSLKKSISKKLMSRNKWNKSLKIGYLKWESRSLDKLWEKIFHEDLNTTSRFKNKKSDKNWRTT